MCRYFGRDVKPLVLGDLSPLAFSYQALRQATSGGHPVSGYREEKIAVFIDDHIDSVDDYDR